MDKQICFCFGYSEADLEQDVREHRKSLIMEKIMAQKKDGGCQCETLNPKGRWCLADVRQVVNKIMNDCGINKETGLTTIQHRQNENW